MNTINTPLGWMFVALATFFSLGLTRRFARRFYPLSPSFLRRLAAPTIFAALAIACFAGAGLHAMTIVATYGLTQIILGRSRPAKCAR